MTPVLLQNKQRSMGTDSYLTCIYEWILALDGAWYYIINEKCSALEMTDFLSAWYIDFIMLCDSSHLYDVYYSPQ